MKKLSIAEVIRLIQQEKTFEATVLDGSFTIKLNRYVPFVCTAIHDGSNLREELKKISLLSDFERWYEEDPHTGDFISSLPITMIAHDSRFEYDLNRQPETCIYEEAWGKKVWKKSLNARQIKTSLKKHENYYRVTQALIEVLERKFGACVVYDMHSYNYKRWDRPVPVFNIGSEKIDQTKFGRAVAFWNERLDEIQIEGIDSQSKINDVFFGRGYNLEFITERFENTLVLATEVKKIYCDELSGQDYPKIIQSLQRKIKRAIVDHAAYFLDEFTNWKSQSPGILDKKIDPELEKIDRKMYQILKRFELLPYVNPNNAKKQFNRFVRSKYNLNPEFSYKPIQINPFELKTELSTLKISRISDVSIRYLYESIINSYFDKIDLLATRGSQKFLYNSLRYFGQPTKRDLENAHYLLHLPSLSTEPKKSPKFGAEQTKLAFEQAIDHLGIKAKVQISRSILSKVMVVNSKRQVLINRDVSLSQQEIDALIAHEIGIHMVTTQNAKTNDLKFMDLGLPVNTRTQEGMAILGEYLSGNLSMTRLKVLALRVVLVDMMCNGADFIQCFDYLKKETDLSNQEAFTMCTRVFRGGGFTKDYLYLNGFVRLYHRYLKGEELSPLLIGKTSVEFLGILEELIDRELVNKAKFEPDFLSNPKENSNSEIFEFILSGLK